MITLSFGYQKPQTGDKGSLFFPALEADIQQLNDHDHDGVNSEKLTSLSITPVSDTIAHAGWIDQGGGTYKQTVTMPAGVTFDAYAMAFRIANGGNIGDEIHPSIKKNALNKYDIFVNDNTIDLTVLYLV